MGELSQEFGSTIGVTWVGVFLEDNGPGCSGIRVGRGKIWFVGGVEELSGENGPDLVCPVRRPRKFYSPTASVTSDCGVSLLWRPEFVWAWPSR